MSTTAFWAPFLAKFAGALVLTIAALVSRYLILPLIPEGRIKSLLTRNVGGDRRADGSLRETVFHRIDRALAELTASRGRRADIERRLSELRSPL